ncbi:MAG TPA: T9SS type A sorting domain-containing protein [Saprospiraceae bacterium]|nr:T9SS type A sorting domain-containing protein [Saprospiraceae bacterium]
MKKFSNFILFIFLLSNIASGQRILESTGISLTHIDVKTEKSVAQITINPTVPGKVITHFDGQCVSTPGDRIFLACSNTTSWEVNDGNTSVQAFDNDLNTNSFSHTRVYEVEAGSHTFYAIAHNYVKTDGDGMVSIYGNFTVEFIPNSMNDKVVLKGVNSTGINVSAKTTVGQLSLNAPEAGRVILQFDGQCYSTPGDRIVLAANNTNSWDVNDGNVSIEAINNNLVVSTFCHTRVFDVQAGNHDYYAIAHNYVETDGDARISVYGSLTATFIPNSTGMIESKGISKTNIDLTNKTVLEQITINPQEAGNVIVHFDGYCISSPGDLIVLAASDSPSWNVNDGNVGVEAINDDVNRNSFSHTRVYEVQPGSHTYYAVAHNYVETDGNGKASIYGNLTVEFIPNTITAVNDLMADESINIYPNPTSGNLNISSSSLELEENTSIKIMDSFGKVLYQTSSFESEISLSDFPNGFYYFQLIDHDDLVLLNRKIVKIN